MQRSNIYGRLVSTLEPMRATPLHPLQLHTSPIPHCPIPHSIVQRLSLTLTLLLSSSQKWLTLPETALLLLALAATGEILDSFDLLRSTLTYQY